MTAPDDQGSVGGLVDRVEVLLSSLTAVVSAKVILDDEKAAQVHIIATSELPVSEVSRAVTSALTWGLGFEVPPNQITVVQSNLSREDLKALLRSEETGDPAPAPDAPGSPPAAPADPTPVPDTGLVEFSLGGTPVEPSSGAIGVRRLELQDFQLDKNPAGGFAISVRLADSNHSIAIEREAAGTEEDSLEVPSSAALDVIQEFLRSGRSDGPSVGLKFLSARRLRHPRHDVVVVVVEAVVRGRRIPMTGAASATNGVERASILATLQATNAFVSGTLAATAGNGTQ